MAKRIVLIGAGSVQFGCSTLGDIFQSKVLEGSHVVLHDINPVSLAKVEAVGQQFIKDNDLPFTLSATTSRPEALQGADFCVISIEVGSRFDLWEMDWRIPQQYGIRQVYGENGGPGGLFHSLRIIPPILDICGDVMKICPDAYVFNFSNPMSRICTTVHRKYPDLKLVGLCHEIGSLRHYLPIMLGVPYSNLHIRAGGLNHFSILLAANYRDSGEDAYSEIRAKSPAFFENMPGYRDIHAYVEKTGKIPTTWEEAKQIPVSKKWAERGLFRVLLEQFGYLPITTDSHLGEYVQWAYDAVDHEGILDFYTMYKHSCLDRVEEPKIELRLTERVIPIIEGILTNSGYEEEAVNLPNNGLIADLPDWIAVEVPAIVDKNGVHGVPLPNYPKAFLGLLQNQVAVHDMTAEAVLSGSRAVVLQALLVDPVVDKYVNVDQMVDVMIELQGRWLGYLK
ncbi:MAG: alpha-glucosidase [Anaerolineae bacterium]|nr:alpha-glucosidase [Anaerolineae bacterium]